MTDLPTGYANPVMPFAQPASWDGIGLRFLTSIMMLPEEERWKQIEDIVRNEVYARTRRIQDQYQEIQELQARREKDIAKRLERLREAEQSTSRMTSRATELLLEIERGASLTRLQALGERMTPGLVYYFERADGLIKIGTTKRVSTRRLALEAEHGKLVLRAVEPGYFRVERYRHLQFSRVRVGRSEWFNRNPSLGRLIRVLRGRYETLLTFCESGVA